MSSERIDHVAATEQLYGTELTEVYSESVICLASLDACLPEEMINVPIETYGSETATSKHETVKAGLDSNQQHYMSLCMDIKDLLIKADAERSGLGAKNELLHILQGKPTPLKTDRGTHQLLGVYDWVMTEEGGQTKPVKDMTYADMAQYVAKLYEVYPPPSQESVQEASEARQSFIGMLESDLFKSLIPDEAIRANMAQVALATPIRIADPLVVAIEYNLDAYENLGMFDPTTRSISIRWDWDKLPSSDKTMDIQTTVFHELLHACESTVYGDEYMSDFFPVFMREAVVEKLAFLMASQLGRGREVARKGTRSELIYRKVVGAADATLVPTRNTPERDVYDQRFDSLEPFTYQQFRLLFDEVFASIDWKKAGINTQEAEQIILLAMFETPNPRARGADRYPRRKALGVALRESGAAGIFRRTEKAIQTLGMQNLLSFIQHPDTNISNPEDLPLTADELEALMISDIDLPILEALHKKGEPLRVPGGQITYRLKDLNDARRGSHTADIIRRQEQELGIKSFGPLTTKELERPLPRKFEKKAKPRSDASYRRRWSPMR